MRDWVVVLPSSLACRRLSELLAIRAEQDGLVLYPPQITTIGSLPEQLYVAKLPFASQLVQHLAWMRVLQDSPLTELHHLIPVPPPKSMTLQWLELGKVLASLHRELASDRMNFQAVAERLKASQLAAPDTELARWQALAKLQQRYLDHLDALRLWDIQTARLYALEHEEPQTSKRILAVGCVDLNQTQRAFLEAVGSQVEFWIAAPDSHAHLFDPLGCLVSERWRSECLNIGSEQLLVGNTPADQANLAVACLAELSDRYHVRDVTLGVPESSLIPELRHRLHLCEVKSRYGPGTPLARSEPVALLAEIGRYLESRSYDAFSALIRHPAVSNLFRNLKMPVPTDWLSRIDRYYQESIPKWVDGFVNEHAPGADVYRTVSGTIDRWLDKISKKPQPISSFVAPLLQAMSSAYERLECDLNDPVQNSVYLAAKQTCDAIVSLRDIPDDVQPKLTASELIDWLINNMQGQLVPEAPDPESVEMLGWLELVLDDAPVLILTGIHDGVVPESVNADAFLPNQLRAHLGMMDNDRRYARDLYSMRVLLETRDALRIVVGKTDASGDPLIPSRLLMACELEYLPARVQHLVSEQTVDVLPPVATRWIRRSGSSQLRIPRPKEIAAPSQISVTAFRDYLKCPYRFYMRHILKLRAEDDALSELGAQQFGLLLHETLRQLQGSIAECSNVDTVREFLLDNLHRLAHEWYGPRPAAAVRIQIEQAEMRLFTFAEKQAERAAKGWQIQWVESEIDSQDELRVGAGTQLFLVGRIDRIDFHPQSGQWAIWDYKTSENAKKPLSVHWNAKQGWMDLQLPLYRKIAAKLGVTGKPSVGYISIPKQAAECGFHVADFDDQLLKSADQIADEIATKVAEGQFWPEQIEAVPFDDFSRVCQTNTRKVTVSAPQIQLQRTREQPVQTISQEVLASANRCAENPVVSRLKIPPLLIRASAGTGKTFQLSNRLLQIVLSGQSLDPILATTFTRKAAGEILHRVLERLSRACIDEVARTELAGHLVGVDISAANCFAALRRVTRSIHRLRISTLDSFFAQVARSFSFEMSLPHGWQVMDPVQEPKFQLQAISRMLDNQDQNTLVGLVRMLAKGESSRRVADEIRQTVNAGYGAFRLTQQDTWDQLPLSSFPSEKALQSALRTIARTRLDHKSADSSLEKLHRDASIGNWESVISHGIFGNLESDCPSYYSRELRPRLISALHILAERAAGELLAIRKNQTSASYKVLSAYDTEYTALVRRQRLLAFADVTHCLSEWMSPNRQLEDGTNSDPDSVLSRQRMEFRLDCGIRHLLLDEFQDTAPEQWSILEPLAKPLANDSDGQHSVFCVGDTKQAIYGWRGGVAEVFESVKKSLPGVQEMELYQSFRSSPDVIQGVNKVFQNLPQHENFSGCESVAARWSARFPAHDTAKKNLPGYVRLQNGPKLDYRMPTEEKRQASLEASTDQIEELVSKSSASIGVLLRTNSEVSRMISLLRDRGIAASQDGGNPLTDSAAVELILSLIHLADHPGDKICAYHVATSPLAAGLKVELSNPFRLAEWFRQKVYRVGLGNALRSIADLLANQLSWWDQHRVEQLIRLAYQFEEAFSGRLREFEEVVETQKIALPSEAQVKVMTIHKSKGLEFDAVFLPDLQIDVCDGNTLLILRGEDPCQPPTGVLRYMNVHLQRMLPKTWQEAFEQHKQRQVSESLCLLYVAMTRARSALYLTTRPSSGRAAQEYGSILQSTLAENADIEQPHNVLYEHGSPDWYRGFPLSSESAGQTGPAEVSESRIRLRSDPDSASLRGLMIAAPSYLGQSAEPVPLAAAFSFSQSLATTYGTLIHAFFEQIRWLDEFRFDREDLRRVAWNTLSPEEMQKISIDQVMDEFQQMLLLGKVRAALSKARYQKPRFGFKPDSVEIDNERPVSLILDGQLVSGTIDRLAVLYRNGQPYAAEIIDYKTDAFDPNMTLLWLEDRIAHHRPQLNAYAKVVSRLFRIPLSQVATYLMMLSTDDFVQVERSVPPVPTADSAATNFPSTPQA